MLDSDPLIKLKSQELDLKAQDDFRKKEETDARINMDKSKLMQATRPDRTKTRTK